MDAGITEETERIELLENVQYFIRKMAHFCEYGLLSCIVYLTVITGEISKKTIKLIEMNGWQIWWKMGIITQCMVTGYAITDEFHQMFVADRYPAVTDVLIDSAGGFTAVVGMTIIFMIARHVKNNKLKKQENALQDGGLT